MSADQAQSFYKSEMNNYLNKNKLPPTKFELNLKENEIRQQTASKYNCGKDDFRDAYKTVENDYKERRHQMLIEAVLGTKNYVPQIN